MLTRYGAIDMEFVLIDLGNDDEDDDIGSVEKPSIFALHDDLFL